MARTTQGIIRIADLSPLMQTAQPIEEIISLVAARGKVSINDVEREFDLPTHSTHSIIDFLIKFGFIRRVEGKYLEITETCVPFFREITH